MSPSSLPFLRRSLIIFCGKGTYQMKMTKPSSADIPIFSYKYPLPPVSRIELQEKYKLLTVSDALMEIPGDIAYQEESIAYIRRDLDAARGMREKLELEAYIQEKGLVADKTAKSKLFAGLSMDEEILSRELDLRLAASAGNFLSNLSISLRKIFAENDHLNSKSFHV